MAALRTPYYHVLLEGVDITSWVQSVTVEEDDRKADQLTLVIPDPQLLYADALFEGTTVEVDLGYAGSGQHALLIRALITKVDLRYPEDGIPMLTLKGEDLSIRMGLQERNQVWRNRRVTDVVRAIAERYDFADVITDLDPDPRIEGRSVHQDGTTDLAFLQELAERYHAKCFVELNEDGREVLYFIPERRVLAARRADQLVLRYRMGPYSNLISFTPRVDINYVDRYRQMHDVDRQGRPVSSQEHEPPAFELWNLNPARVAQVNRRDQTRVTTLYTIGAVQTLELQGESRAAAIAVGTVAVDQTEYESINVTLETRSQGHSSQGRTFGNIWLRAKSIITLEGLHERFNGEWYVNNVQHKIDINGYVTDFKCER